jgi:type IV pilus assembly protein PilX
MKPQLLIAVCPPDPHQQRGVVLVVTMVVLILVTLIGVASIRLGVFQERMTTNTVDRNIAFQAAEAALREGEALADSQSLLGNAGFPAAVGGGALLPGTVVDSNPNDCDAPPCNDGLCSMPDPLCVPRWEDPAVTWRTASGQGFQSGTAPQFIVEYLGANFPCDPTDSSAAMTCKRYRITARSIPADGRAMVMLQSIYAAE